MLIPSINILFTGIWAYNRWAYKRGLISGRLIIVVEQVGCSNVKLCGCVYIVLLPLFGAICYFYYLVCFDVWTDWMDRFFRFSLFTISIKIIAFDVKSLLHVCTWNFLHKPKLKCVNPIVLSRLALAF